MRHTGSPLLCWLVTTQPLPCFPKRFKYLSRKKSEFELGLANTIACSWPG